MGSATGGALNPTRYFGPQIGSFLLGGFEWHGKAADMWVYLMPFLGAIAAAFTWMALFYSDGEGGSGDDVGND